MWVLGSKLHTVKEQQEVLTDEPFLQALPLNDLFLFVCGVKCVCVGVLYVCRCL